MTISPLIQDLINNPEVPTGIFLDALKQECPEFEQNKMVIYLVSGGTPDREGDWIEWKVCCFLDYEKARKFVDKLKDWCIENKCNQKSQIGMGSSQEEKQRLALLKNPFDPEFYCLRGTAYYIEQISLKG